MLSITRRRSIDDRLVLFHYLFRFYSVGLMLDKCILVKAAISLRQPGSSIEAAAKKSTHGVLIIVYYIVGVSAVMRKSRRPHVELVGL